MKNDPMKKGKHGAYLIATPAISLPLLVTDEKKTWNKVVATGKKRLPVFSLCGSDSCIEDL